MFYFLLIDAIRIRGWLPEVLFNSALMPELFFGSLWSAFFGVWGVLGHSCLQFPQMKWFTPIDYLSSTVILQLALPKVIKQYWNKLFLMSCSGNMADLCLETTHCGFGTGTCKMCDGKSAFALIHGRKEGSVKEETAREAGKTQGWCRVHWR